MNIVGRIKLPKSDESSALYIQCNGAASLSYEEENKGVMLRQGESLSSSSYFNSFYERYYTKYTTLHSIYYLLKLEGSFKVSVYREGSEGSDRAKIFEENFENCQLSNPVSLPPINLRQGAEAGRLYMEIICLSEQGIFQEGLIVTDETKSRDVSLGIVICTFKKEDYVKNTLATLLQDQLLQHKDFKVFVVDNGRTLEKANFSDPRLELIPNKNAGGSGGFTRGLVEALAEETNYSHFLVMDDDIELESESILRLFSLHEYAKSDFVVAGGLLNLNKKYVLYEAGATFNEDPKSKGAFGSLTALNHNMDLRNADALNQLLIEEDADYGGFWFCSFSREIIEKIKLPLPLFIKLDDVEFCLRAKKVLGAPIVTFPSIAVWHLPASAKNLNWETYYYFRNDLITYAIHFSPSYADTVSNLTKEIMASLLKSDYDRAQMLIKAFEDYLKGSDFIKHSEPDILHSSILKLSRTYENQDQVDQLTSIQLLDRWSSVVAQSKIDWSSVSKDWKSAAKEITTTKFWRQYLGLEEPIENLIASQTRLSSKHSDLIALP